MTSRQGPHASLDAPFPAPYLLLFPVPQGSAMTFTKAVAALWAKHPKADLSPSVKRGTAFERAARVKFKAGKGGVYAGKDADGTEVLVYFNDTANVISCTEMEPDLGPDVE